MRRILTVLFLIIVITVPFAAFDILPDIGDPGSAPNTHLSDYYIEHAVEECNSPNMVTAVIVDYRAFDTMFETTVMFLAGLSVILITANSPRKKYIGHSETKKPDKASTLPVYKSVNKDVMISVIEPLILIYAMYVLFHGEVSLGGGFQAGALIGMTYLLDVMVAKRERPIFDLPKFRAASLAGIGPLIYAITGIVCIAGGGLYLDSEALTYKTNKLTVDKKYRNLRIPLSDIKDLTWKWILFPVATFSLKSGEKYAFIIFNKKRFVKHFKEYSKKPSV
jgi:multicomponent Na+:H+ antiporter subunit B